MKSWTNPSPGKGGFSHWPPRPVHLKLIWDTGAGPPGGPVRVLAVVVIWGDPQDGEGAHAGLRLPPISPPAPLTRADPSGSHGCAGLQLSPPSLSPALHTRLSLLLLWHLSSLALDHRQPCALSPVPSICLSRSLLCSVVTCLSPASD